MELNSPNIGLLSCVVYPDLHNIVFKNLEKLQFADLFIFNTHKMVLSGLYATELNEIEIVFSHPAPSSLIPSGAKCVLVNSNVAAANAHLDNAGRKTACITTKKAADARKFKIFKDFGEIPMGFALHTLKN